jgi:class 3 adenylate cyclase
MAADRMRCPRCSHDAPAGAEFCPDCGVRLVATCAQCGTANAAGHKFCVKCGAGLTPAESPRSPTVAAERRQLTVMFCDLVGSTALSSALDPEEMRELIRAYQDICAMAIARFEGHVAQYLGDGLLVYFGYPQAHEDDARRAVRAALEIIESIERAGDERLTVRVGIHTGLVVVGEIGRSGRHENLALGETPNLAARLQGLAAPGTVVVGEATRRLTERAFRWRDLGAHTVKGVSEPQRIWQAIAEVGGAGPSRVAAAGSAALIGRDGEMGLLRQRWEQAGRGDGQVVLLTGDPGIGKSRLVEALVDAMGLEPASVLRYFCSPYYQNSALYPFAAHIEHSAGIAPEDPPAVRLDALERWLDAGGGGRESAPLLAALLSIPFTERYAPLDLTPPAQREKTLRTIEEQLLRWAGAGPVLAIFEDAHWIDPTSRSLLERLVELVPRLPVVLVVTARPDFTAPWARLPHVTLLTLNHLGRSEAAHLIAQVARGQALPAALIDGIVERAEGIPLYLEEITKATIEGRETDADHRIPATLRDSLTARLDRLGPVKEVAQAAAVIGREFDDELLSSIVSLPDDQRRRALDQLMGAQLVAERRHPGHTVHYFRHALIQEAAYQSLLNVTRRGYHGKIAEALEARFPDRAGNEPETLAQHFMEAGDEARAIPYWLRAGQRAAQRSANLEAVEHLQKGRALVQHRPAGRTRDEQELGFLIALGPALMATRGWNAPEVEEIYSRARTLATQTGRSTDIFPAVWGRWLVAHAGGDAQLARDLLGELRDLLGDTDDPHLHLQFHHAAGGNWCSDSDLPTAMTHAETVVRTYRFDEHRQHALVYGGHDPCVCAQSIGALTALMAGHLTRAQRWSDDALALAARVEHAPSVAHAEWYRVELCHIRGEAEEAEARAERVFALALEKGSAHYAAWARMMLGWALVQRGAVDAGLTTLEEGRAALRATAITYHIPHRLAVRADAFAAAGRIADARDAIEEALESVARAGEIWYEPEVLRIKAELLLMSPKPDEVAAERCLEEALAIAGARGARFWALRAAVALARVQARQNREAAARSVLAAALRGFEAERQVPEIADAIALLERLRGSIDTGERDR